MSEAQDLGPLDWRIAITDSQGRPTPEFQRRWATQRNNNALIGAITLGNGVPPVTPAPSDGAEFVNTATTPYTVYIGKGGTWHQAGAVNFTDLQDAPHIYTGAAGQFAQVNPGATALQFATAVTSVGLVLPNILTVTGSPVTTTGTLSATLVAQAANTFFSGPTSGGSVVPTFRTLVPTDLPLFSSSQAGAVPSSGGGTTNFLRADGTWATPPTGGGGAGNPPTIVQFGFSNNLVGPTVTLSSAPTSGNLLVALVSAGGNGVAAGWTSIATSVAGGTFGLIATKVAGVGESTSQTPCSATGNSTVAMWELHGQNSTAPVVVANTGAAASSQFTSTASEPGLSNVLALGAITGDSGTAVTFNSLLNMTQDVMNNGGAKGIVAGHSTGAFPIAQAIATLTVAAATRNHIILVTR